jgi:hypothetical protein
MTSLPLHTGVGLILVVVVGPRRFELRAFTVSR